VAVLAALAATAALPASNVGARSERALDDVAVRGEVRVLVVLATWGPRPFTRDQAQRVVFDETDAFFRASSYGQVSLAGVVTPWLTAFSAEPRCDPLRVARAARTAAGAAGHDTGSFDYVIYLTPQLDCGWSGLSMANEVMLNGELYRKLVAHELGHGFGLYHANTASCGRLGCAADEYGDPYGTMGSGDGDFNAYEKYRLGWLRKLAWGNRSRTVQIDGLEGVSKGPKALVVTTAGEQYWIENRRRASRSDRGRQLEPGVLVRIGPPRVYPNGRVVVTTSDTLVADPAGRGRAVLRAGERFALPGAFSATVLRAGERARIRFRWTDAKPPRAPTALVTEETMAGRLRVGWADAYDVGSGIAHYDVLVDGKPRARLAARAGKFNLLSLPLPRVGRHLVAVVAVDRAGNRSVAASRRFSVVDR
jgi:hypothetical protein